MSGAQLTDEEIEAVCRSSSDVSGIIAFRQLQALESIAESLSLLSHPPMTFGEDGKIRPVFSAKRKLTAYLDSIDLKQIAGRMTYDEFMLRTLRGFVEAL